MTDPAIVFNKLLRTLASIRRVAERAPNPPADLVAIHGERAHMVSSFAMLRMMAEHAIETIEELTNCTLAKANKLP